MIKPFASDTLNPLFIFDDKRRSEIIKEAESLPSIVVSSAAASNAVMLGCGYFNPLTGYMNMDDALRVAEDMHTTAGLFWPTPVLNLLKDVSPIKGAKRIALRDPNVEGNPIIAVQEVEGLEQITPHDKKRVAERVFKTTDTEHPGVATFLSLGDMIVSGSVQVVSHSYFKKDFPNSFRTALQLRQTIERKGWKEVVAFQTRNPMHRAHEELVKMAMKEYNADGAIIHMLLGKLKSGDIPADVREDCIRKMAELYFQPGSVEIAGYGFDMMYAGPREAVLHAIFRQNMGATVLIVGRDHAGVGNYYGGFDAQTIFDTIPEGTFEIKIFRGDHTVWCKKCDKVVMMRDCPHDKEDYIMLSGTRVRELLAADEDLPPEFSRPEVAEILKAYYKDEAGK